VPAAEPAPKAVQLARRERIGVILPSDLSAIVNVSEGELAHADARAGPPART